MSLLSNRGYVAFSNLGLAHRIGRHGITITVMADHPYSNCSLLCPRLIVLRPSTRHGETRELPIANQRFHPGHLFGPKPFPCRPEKLFGGHFHAAQCKAARYRELRILSKAPRIPSEDRAARRDPTHPRSRPAFRHLLLAVKHRHE